MIFSIQVKWNQYLMKPLASFIHYRWGSELPKTSFRVEQAPNEPKTAETVPFCLVIQILHPQNRFLEINLWKKPQNHSSGCLKVAKWAAKTFEFHKEPAQSPLCAEWSRCGTVLGHLVGRGAGTIRHQAAQTLSWPWRTAPEKHFVPDHSIDWQTPFSIMINDAAYVAGPQHDWVTLLIMCVGAAICRPRDEAPVAALCSASLWSWKALRGWIRQTSSWELITAAGHLLNITQVYGIFYSTCCS